MKEQKVLTFDMAVAGAVAAMLKMGPGFVYNEGAKYTCAYVPTGHPGFKPTTWAGESMTSSNNPAAQLCGCIVGEILMHNDMMTPEIAGIYSGISALIGGSYVLVDSDETRTLLSAMQTEQDSGLTWGQAFLTALEDVRTRNINL